MDNTEFQRLAGQLYKPDLKVTERIRMLAIDLCLSYSGTCKLWYGGRPVPPPVGKLLKMLVSLKGAGR